MGAKRTSTRPLGRGCDDGALHVGRGHGHDAVGGAPLIGQVMHGVHAGLDGEDEEDEREHGDEHASPRGQRHAEHVYNQGP